MPVLPIPTEERPTDINYFGWRRFLLRLEQRALWHARGVLLWLVRRPHLRKLPTPWPGTQTAKQYLEQPGGKNITPKVFEELCALRSKIGLRRSFIQSTTVLMALRIGFRHREPTLQPGAPAGVDGEEKGISSGKSATYRPPAYSRLRLTDARNRLRLYGLDPSGRRLGELQILIRDCRGSHGWGLEEQFDAQVASAVSFEHRRTDGTIYAKGKAPPIYHLNGMYQHFKKGKDLTAAPPTDANPGAAPSGSRQAPVPCPEYDQAYIAPLVQRLEQALNDLQSERSSLRSGDRSTPSHRGQRVETYSLLSEDEGMEDDEFEQDPILEASRDHLVEEPEHED